MKLHSGECDATRESGDGQTSLKSHARWVTLRYPAPSRAAARVQGELSMQNRVVPRWVVAFVSTAVVVVLDVTSTAGQSTTAGSYRAPRTLDGKPDISGIWQVLN